MICMTSTWKSYIFLNRRRDFYGFRTDELKLALMFYCIFSCVRIRWFPISLIHMRKSNALPHVPSALNFRRDCDSTSFIHDSVQTLQTSYRKSIYLSFVNMHWTIADESKFMDSIWVQLFLSSFIFLFSHSSSLVIGKLFTTFANLSMPFMFERERVQASIDFWLQFTSNLYSKMSLL